jgi:hypothetical protein
MCIVQKSSRSICKFRSISSNLVILVEEHLPSPLCSSELKVIMASYWVCFFRYCSDNSSGVRTSTWTILYIVDYVPMYTHSWIQVSKFNLLATIGNSKIVTKNLFEIWLKSFDEICFTKQLGRLNM